MGKPCSPDCTCGRHVVPEERKRKISATKKGRPRSEQHNKALSDALRGRVISDQTKQKISQTLTGRSASKETRQKLSGVARSRPIDHYLKAVHTKRIRGNQGPTSQAILASIVAHTTHGLSHHPHYHRWRSMMRRCYDLGCRGYRYYGERGIAVYDEWHDVAAFILYLEEELGSCPADYTMDRIDNDGDYRPGNIRWVSASEQVQNRRPREQWSNS